MSAEAAFQAALIAHLSANLDVQAVLGNPARIYDGPPGGARFPYVEIARGESEPADGDDVSLIDHRLTIRILARKGELDQLKSVLGAVRSAAHNAELTLTGDWRCVSCRVVYADVFKGDNTRLLQGLLRVRAVLEKLS